jgi:hypothetical protein
VNFAAKLVEPVDPTEIGQSDNEGALDDLRANFAKQLDRGHSCPTRRDQIVDEKHFLAGLDRADMQLDSVLPIFEIKIAPDCRSGQFAGFAHWNESDTQQICDGSTKDEPPRLDSNDKVDVTSPVPIGDPVDCKAEAFWIEEKGRNVAELNSWLRVIGDRSDEGSESHGAFLRFSKEYQAIVSPNCFPNRAQSTWTLPKCTPTRCIECQLAIPAGHQRFIQTVPRKESVPTDPDASAIHSDHTDSNPLIRGVVHFVNLQFSGFAKE